jgi:hypothetical protein
MLAAFPRPRNPFAIAAERLDPNSPRAAAEREREAAMADIRQFARHTKIQDPEGKEVAFAGIGWAWQFALLALWAMTKLSVTLKGRQLGVSWLAAMFALWTAIRRSGQAVLLVSKKQDDADKLLAKVAYIWERLPDWKPRAIVNTRSISFPGLGSEIEAMPASPDVGRSRTVNLVILDEHGHQPYADEILLSVKSAAEHGQILAVSTGNGIGVLHSRLYNAAKKGNPMMATQLADGKPLPLRVSARGGPNGWRAIFLPFNAHPQRDSQWLIDARAELDQLTDAQFAQENPRNDVEAIQTSGSPIFALDKLTAWEQLPGTPIVGIAGARWFEEPRLGALYSIGADPAEGNADSDWSSASVLRIEQVDGERYRGEQVAVLRGRWPPEIFAVKLDKLARHYGIHATAERPRPVLLAWERNNHGHAVRVELERLHTPGAPYAMFRARDKHYGWLQTHETRTVLVDQLAAAVRNDQLDIHDAGTVEQFATFHENDHGRAEAQEGFHDDDVIAVGVGWQMRRRLFGIVLDIPTAAETPAKAAA